MAGQALAQLYQYVRLYVNYFQPSFKLLSKERQRVSIKKFYDKHSTPYHRILNYPKIKESRKIALKVQSIERDPVYLLHQIRDKQSALAALSSPDDHIMAPSRKSLEEFLAQLPTLWQQGDARPTHSQKTLKIRNWRTRKNPFKEVWVDVLHWLQRELDTTAKELFKRLQQDYPERFTDGQLRSMQRRVREWRHIIAKKLVYSCLDMNSGYDNIAPIGVKGQSDTIPENRNP